MEREITTLTRQAAPRLLEQPGCGALTAAKIVRETASQDGCALRPASPCTPAPPRSPPRPGRTHRHRLARGGNRQLNVAVHRIAVTHVRLPGSLGQAYYQRRRALEATPPWKPCAS